MKKIVLLVLFMFFINNTLLFSQNTYKLFHENGRISQELNFKNDTLHGECNMWDEEGNLIAIGFYENGQKNSIWLVWHSNGTIAYKLHYLNGVKYGLWKAFDEDGELISSITY